MATICPNCGLEDQTSKVSAIVASQTHVVHGTIENEEEYRDAAGNRHTRSTSTPYTATQRSELAQRLALPERPQANPAMKAAAILLAILFTCSILCIPLLFIPFLMYRKYQEQVKEAEVELPRWEKARGRWERLYYCGRDDVVFDPVGGVAIPVREVRRYLYS